MTGVDLGIKFGMGGEDDRPENKSTATEKMLVSPIISAQFWL